MSTKAIPARSEVDPRWTWDHTNIFSSLTEWKNTVKELPEKIRQFEDQHRSPTESAQDLLAALQAKFELLNEVERAYLYAGMFHAVDTTDQAAAKRYSQARSLYSRAVSALAYIEPLVIEAGQSRIQSWLNELPTLGRYEHYIDNLFRKSEHIRSSEIESILGMLSDSFSGTSATIRMLTDADFEFRAPEGKNGEKIAITQGNLPSLITEPDRNLRREVWNSYLDEHVAHRNSLTAGLETSIKQNVFTAQVRKFDNTLEAALFEHNIPTTVFHTLIETFQENLPTWHRYFALRREILGVEELHPYDLWAPLTEAPPEIPYEQAVEWITAGLAPMGEEYVETVRSGCLDERWVDVYPNIGKRKGAFSWGVPGTLPFIVMSYGETIFSMSTLAHELGHSMHSLMAWQTQPLVYGDYSLFVAEVASNFHQALVRAHLLDSVKDRNTQIAVIEEAMANFLRYFFIMPTLARFELDLHQRIERGEGLNADLMIETMINYFTEGFGGEVDFDRKRLGMFWATFGHLYVDYYVFQYATGISGAHAAASKILQGESGARQAYLKFLKTGGSEYPLDALLIAGIDLKEAEPIEQTFGIMATMVDRLEKIAAE